LYWKVVVILFCSTWNIIVRGRRYLPLTTPIDFLAFKVR
jgi:hypothetical protein